MESFDRHCRELVAAKGIIYLMFVGRKIKVYDLRKELKKTGIVKEISVAYQYVNDLERGDYIKRIEEKKGRGSPKIRTANLGPIFETIGVSRRLVEGLFLSKNEYSMKGDEEKDLELMFEKVGGIIDFFPKYLRLRLGEESKFRNLEWREMLSYFLHFCIEVLDECNVKKKIEIIKGEYASGEELPSYEGWPSEIPDATTKRRIMIANIVERAIKKKTLSEGDIATLANLSEEGHSDINRRGTFLNFLYLTALSLVNPEAAYTIEKFIKDNSS